MSAWHPSAARAHVVSIHAAQGPPDRTPSAVPERAPSRAGHSRGGDHRNSHSRAGPPSANNTPSSATHHYFIPRPEVLNLAPGERFVTPTVASSSILSPQTFAVNQMMTTPSTSSSTQHVSIDFGRPASAAPTITAPYGSKVPSHYTPSISSQHGYAPMIPISRNPSANSHHSPGQVATLQIPGLQHGPVGGVARTPSNNSQHTETATPRPPSVIAIHPPAPPLASHSSASMYPSAQNSSPASRSSHVPPVSSAPASVSQSASHSHPNHGSNNFTPASASALASAHENASVQNALSRTSSNIPALHQNTQTQLHSYPNPVHANHHASQSSPQDIYAAMELSQHQPTSSAMHHSTSNHRSTDHTAQAQAYAGRSSSNGIHTQANANGNSPRMTGPERSTRLHDGGAIADAQPISTSQFTTSSTGSPSHRSQPSSTGATAGSSLIRSTNISSSSAAPAVPPGFTPPTGQPSRAYSQTTGLPVMQPSPIALSRSQDVAPSTRVPMNGSTSIPTPTLANMRVPDRDSPPPLTPSSSPSSLDEVLMTPSLLDPAKGSSQPQQITVTMERPENPKKKSGIFGLFRSSSTKSPKDARELREEMKEMKHHRSQASGPGPGSGPSTQPHKSEGAKLRSSRHPLVAVGAAHTTANDSTLR